MIIPDEQIQAIVFPFELGSAFINAQIHYATFRRIRFEDDLLDYLKNGFVVSRPNLFAMAKVIVHPRNSRKAAWFIRYAWGPISEIYKVLPFHLDDIVWCRNDDGKLRLYNTDRLLRYCSNMPRTKPAARKLEVMEAI